MHLSVIVPARNEEDVLEACLESLLRQSVEGFLLGEDWELLLVDDHSTDATRQIAQRLQGVAVLDPAPLQPFWTGKANALWTAARRAQGEWLLFTDADTVHRPGSLERALREAEDSGSALLSYSPKQVVKGFWQRAMMPLVFSELAAAYPPGRVTDPTSDAAAANGQFLLIRREVYFEIGGHAAVSSSLLEDVDLASLVKRGKHAIRFHYAPDALSANMYRSAGAMIEGWTRNLARLFAHSIALAAWRAVDLLLLIGLPLLAWLFFSTRWARYSLLVLWALMLLKFFSRVAKSNFSAVNCALSVFGVPLFCALLVRSRLRYAAGKQVAWKGREYSTAKR